MEKPRNGVRGLKHWRYDLMAGLQVALIGLSLSAGNRGRFRRTTHYLCDIRHNRLIHLYLPWWSLCDDQRTGCRSCASTSGRHDYPRPWRRGCGISALTGGDLSDRGDAVGVESLQCREIRLVLSHFSSRRHDDYHQTNSAIPGGNQLPPVKSIPEAILAIPHDIHGMNQRSFSSTVFLWPSSFFFPVEKNGGPGSSRFPSFSSA